MTRVSFYICQDDRAGARERIACRLAAQGYSRGQRVYITVPDAGAGRRLDELLWTFRDQSFVPHEQAGAGSDCPVVIGHAAEPDGDFDVLVNLGNDVPHFFSRFPRTIEIIDADPDTRRQGRERYRFYRDRGYPLENHDV